MLKRSKAQVRKGKTWAAQEEENVCRVKSGIETGHAVAFKTIMEGNCAKRAQEIIFKDFHFLAPLL